MALGQALTVGPKHERHVDPRWAGSAQQVEEVGLAWRDIKEIVTAHHLLDALVGIVHHDREVVGGHSVVATQHDVVRRVGQLAVEAIYDRHDLTSRPKAKGGGPTGRLPRGDLAIGQIATRTQVAARNRVRRGSGLADLSAAAEAGKGQTALDELGEGRFVLRTPSGLPHDGPVPIETQLGEICELACLVLERAGQRIKVLDAEQEPAARGSSEQPRHEGSPEVSDMEIPGWAGGEASDGHVRRDPRRIPRDSRRRSSYAAPVDIAILLFDRLTALDAVGPYEVLSRLPDARVTFVASEPGLKRTDTTFLGLMADASLADLPHPDILLVPGGPGQVDAEKDEAVLEWLRAAHATTTWTTSVCTGSLVLGAAGLLDGKRATTYWLALEELARHGATPVNERVVIDGKIVTAAGVSSGIDMALTLAAHIGGDDLSRTLQLGIEYDPQPPFDSGSEAKAPAHISRIFRDNSRFVLEGG